MVYSTVIMVASFPIYSVKLNSSPIMLSWPLSLQLCSWQMFVLRWEWRRVTPRNLTHMPDRPPRPTRRMRLLTSMLPFLPQVCLTSLKIAKTHSDIPWRHCEPINCVDCCISQTVIVCLRLSYPLFKIVFGQFPEVGLVLRNSHEVLIVQALQGCLYSSTVLVLYYRRVRPCGAVLLSTLKPNQDAQFHCARLSRGAVPRADPASTKDLWDLPSHCKLNISRSLVVHSRTFLADCMQLAKRLQVAENFSAVIGCMWIGWGVQDACMKFFCCNITLTGRSWSARTKGNDFWQR